MISFARRQNDVVVEQVGVPDTAVGLAARRAAATPADAEAMPAMLPSTASHMPAILALGLLSFVVAGFLRTVRSRARG